MNKLIPALLTHKDTELSFQIVHISQAISLASVYVSELSSLIYLDILSKKIFLVRGPVMNRFFSFIAKYFVAASVVSGILLLVIAAGLIFNPALLETIFRYGLAIINVALACYLIFGTLYRSIFHR